MTFSIETVRKNPDQERTNQNAQIFTQDRVTPCHVIMLRTQIQILWRYTHLGSWSKLKINHSDSESLFCQFSPKHWIVLKGATLGTRKNNQFSTCCLLMAGQNLNFVWLPRGV